LESRLGTIYSEVCALIDKYKPDAVAVEELFFNTNVKTAIAVGHGRGVILLACGNCKVPVFEYTPLQVKQSVTGYGRADKNQVQQMTRVLLNLAAVPKPDDTADALAVAICHCHSAASKMCR
jgi:crossover junction endodeoxyribonuclease RuvC